MPGYLFIVSRYAQEEQVAGETGQAVLHASGDAEAFGVRVDGVDAANDLLELDRVEAALQLDGQLDFELDTDAVRVVALDEHFATCGGGEPLLQAAHVSLSRGC